MAAAGHELKTPTAAIHNYLQLVDRHLADGQARGGGHVRRPRACPRRGAWRRSSSGCSTSAGSRAASSSCCSRSSTCGDVVRSAVEVAQVLPKAPPITVKAGADAGARPGGSGPARAGVPQPAGQRHRARAGLGHDRGHGQGSSDGRGRGRGPRPRTRDRGEDLRTMFEAYTRLGQPQRAPGLGLGPVRRARDRDGPRAARSRRRRGSARGP